MGENSKFEILRTPQDVKDYLTNKMENLNMSFYDTSEHLELIEKVREKVRAAFTQDELTSKIIHDALHSIHELENLISSGI